MPSSFVTMNDAPTTKHLAVGTSFLVGSVLLLPGFNMICPTAVNTLSPPIVPVPIFIPQFKEDYPTGINLILVGVGLVILGAVGQLILTLQAATPCIAKFGGVMLILGSCLLEFGSVIFLPAFSKPFGPEPPVEIFGKSAPDFGGIIFQAASCVYLVSALTAIFGSVMKVSKRRAEGRSPAGAIVEMLAFCLFIPVSVLFFANGMLPSDQALKAGAWRMAAAVCLFAACFLLFIVTLAEFLIAKRAGVADKLLP